MGDWSDQEARRLAEHIHRTSERLEALSGRYGQLHALLAPGTGRPVDFGMPVSRDPGPRLPLRVDVLDLMEAIDSYLAGFLPLVRGTLRLGEGAGTWKGTGREQAMAGLSFLAAGLATVYTEDPGLGDDLSRGAWKLERRACWIFGEKSKPFALVEACPECGVQALWVVPDRMVIRCGNPECRTETAVDAAFPAHTSESQP
jgi:hypothetical protein